MAEMVLTREGGSVGSASYLGPHEPNVQLVVTLNNVCLHVRLSPANAARLGASLIADSKSAEPWSEQWEAGQKATAPETEDPF